MALRGDCPVLLLTLGLLVACLSLASGQFRFSPPDNFLKMHLDYPKSPPYNLDDYCNVMMRKIKQFGKPEHIFIHEHPGKICDVCHNVNGWVKSKIFFRATKCTFNFLPQRYTGIGLSARLFFLCRANVPIDVQACKKGNPWGWRADGEQFESLESWSVPSDRYMAPSSSSTSEHCSEGSNVFTPPSSAAPSEHCTI